MQRPSPWQRFRSVCLRYHGFFWLTLAFALVLYYIFGPSRIEFHSDCTDTLMWARATQESGKLLDPDFSYACFLPFGGSLLMLLWYPFFGLSMLTHQLGMATFTVLFLWSVFWCFCKLGFSKNGSACACAATLLLLTGGVKIREIFFGHVIYYSLGVLLLLVGFALCLPLLEAASPHCTAEHRFDRRFYARLALFLTFLCFAAVNGLTAILLCIFPLVFLVVWEWLCDKETPAFSRANAVRYGLFLLILLATGAGLLFYLRLTRGLEANYAGAYSRFFSPEEWKATWNGLGGGFLELFGVSVDYGVTFDSVKGVLAVFRLMGGLLIAAAPVVSLCRFSKWKNPAFRRFLLLCYAMDGALLFFYLFTAIGAANWRLTPFLATSVMIGIGMIREGWVSPTEGVAPFSFAKRWSACFTVFVLVMCSIHAANLLALSNDVRENPHYAVADYLEAQQLSYGFATFWHANAITVISDGAVSVNAIRDEWYFQTEEIVAYHYQSARRHYTETHDRYFILLTATEYEKFHRTLFAEYTHPTETLTFEDYYILIYPENPITL